MSTTNFGTEVAFLQKITGDASSSTITYWKQMVNTAYRTLSMEGMWPWLRYSSHLNLEGTYTTGTVTVTKGSTAVTSSGATFTTSWTDRELRTASGAIYRIASFPSASTATLETAASKTETDVGYTVFRRRYTLPARMRVIESMYPATQPRFTILPVQADEMAAMLSDTLPFRDPPQWWTPCDVDTTNYVPRVEFYPVPANDQTVQFRGMRFPADLSADADVFLFSDDYLDAYRQKVLELVFQWRNDYERSNYHRGAYRQAVDLLHRRMSPDAERGDALLLDENYFSASGDPRDGIARHWRVF